VNDCYVFDETGQSEELRTRPRPRQPSRSTTADYNASREHGVVADFPPVREINVCEIRFEHMAVEIGSSSKHQRDNRAPLGYDFRGCMTDFRRRQPRTANGQPKVPSVLFVHDLIFRAAIQE
jgi:hypothetical protein